LTTLDSPLIQELERDIKTLCFKSFYTPSLKPYRRIATIEIAS